MAKLKAPLMSLGASGALGKALVFFPWKGLDVVREYVVPSNPRTAAQTTQRGYVTDAVAMVHAAQALAASPLGATDITAYALWASAVQAATTWFNQVVKNFIDQKVAGLTGNLYRGGVTTPAADSLVVTVTAHAQAPTAGSFWYGTSKTALIHSQAASFVAAKASATIAGLVTGTKYYWQFRPTAPAALVGSYSGIYYGKPT